MTSVVYALGLSAYISSSEGRRGNGFQASKQRNGAFLTDKAAPLSYIACLARRRESILILPARKQVRNRVVETAFVCVCLRWRRFAFAM
jgi:hypothetical protein